MAPPRTEIPVDEAAPDALAASGHTMSPTLAVQIPRAGLPATVTAVPMGDTGLSYLPYGVYLRRWSKHKQQQLYTRTTHLGYIDPADNYFKVFPITRWWLIGSANAIPSTFVANLAAIMRHPGLQADWFDASTLVELGTETTVSLPRGSENIQGVRHYLLDVLLQRASVGGTLTGVPTLGQMQQSASQQQST